MTCKKSLDKLYVDAYKEIFNFAILPVQYGAALGSLAGIGIAMLTTKVLKCDFNTEETAYAYGSLGGKLVGGAIGLSFLPVTAPTALVAGANHVGDLSHGIRFRFLLLCVLKNQILL